MKLRFYSLFSLFFILTSFVSCSSDSPSGGEEVPTKLTIKLSEITFNSDGGTQNLEFYSPQSWSISLSESGGDTSWCTLFRTSGDKGYATVKITTRRNDSYDERNVSLTVVAGDERKSVTIVQKQKDAILLTSDKVEIGEEGGEFVIELATNVEYNVEISPQCQSWIHKSPATRSLTSHHLRFTADKNEFTEKREGSIIFSAAGITEEVMVYQSEASALILSTNRQFLPPSSGRFSVELKSNMEYEWEVTKGGDWLHPDFTRSMSSHTLFFTYDENLSELDKRTAQVVFKVPSGETALLEVEQHPKGKIILNDDIVNIPASGGEFMISYDATSRMSADYPEWMEQITNYRSSRGIEAYNLWFRAKPNHLEESRTGNIRIYDYLNPSLSESIVIRQEGSKTELNLSCPEGAFNDARTHTFTINVTSNVPYSLEVPDVFVKLGNNKYRIDGSYSQKNISYNISLMVGGNVVKSAMISRAEPITPRISKDASTLSGDGGDIDVYIYCNSDMTLTIPASATWVTLKNKKIAEMNPASDVWTFTVAPNSSASNRECLIEVSGPKNFKENVRIEQKGQVPAVGADGTVTLPSVGQLAEALGEERMKTMTAMAISGQVNGEDIATIRNMSTNHHLVNLDLSKTNMKGDPGHTYFTGHPYSVRYPGIIAKDNQIGNFMFYQTKLQKVTLPNNITEIGYGAFSKSDITSIVIPEGVVSIMEDCFNACHSLQSVVLPATLKEIPSGAFFECYALKEVVIPHGVTKIGSKAFTPKDATSTKGSLSSVSISSTVTHIGDFAFNCQKLTSIEVPSSVSEMGVNVFKENRNLKSATFHNTMEVLPRGTLESCTALTTLRLPTNLKVIGQSALAHTGLKSFVVPEGVTELGISALEGMSCTSLTLPTSLKKIGSWALGQLYYLTEITIPASVNSMGTYALGSPCGLQRIHLKGSNPPKEEGEVFSSNFDYTKCILFVPKGSKETYSNHKIWGKFKDIREE